MTNNSFNLNKYVENTKPKQSNLFMHEIVLRFRALSDLERIKSIGHDWNQVCMKKIGKYLP